MYVPWRPTLTHRTNTSIYGNDVGRLTTFSYVFVTSSSTKKFMKYCGMIMWFATKLGSINIADIVIQLWYRRGSTRV